MSKLVCKHCKDEFCVNDQCPMRADYCPVPDMPGVCKHEERVREGPESNKLTPQECFEQSFVHCGVSIHAKTRDEVYESFRVLLVENGWNIFEDRDEFHNDTPKNNTNFTIGQIVNINEITNSDEWEFERKWKDHDIHESIIYVTKDKTLMVSFDDGNSTGTIFLNRTHNNVQKNKPAKNCEHKFVVGQEVTEKEIANSDDWVLKSIASSPIDTSCSYMTIDKKMVVRFNHESSSGVIEHYLIGGQFKVGQRVHIAEIRASKDWNFLGNANNTPCYVSADDTMSVAFVGDDWGTIMRLK